MHARRSYLHPGRARRARIAKPSRGRGGTRRAIRRRMTMSSTMTALEAIFARRATRSFKPDLVAEDAIHTLLSAAVRAPTAMHAEPWCFAVVQDREVLRRISDRAKALAVEHRLIASAAPAPTRASAGLFDPAFNIFYDAGTLIVICSRTIGAFATADCWLAAQTLMLAATSIGLATCPIGFAVDALQDPAIKTALDIPPGVTAIVPIVVGVAAGAVPASSRRDPQILCWLRAQRSAA